MAGNSMRPPDTSIKCPICKGTKKGQYGQECGACFGFGLSTTPWDQRRNGTTVTLWNSEDRRLPADTKYHGPGKEVIRQIGMRQQRGLMYLISWPNQDYRGT